MKKQKGQGLVEFALILPVLLLMLVGIIEAARIIWAYMTVQTAVREAARYAVSGKPYAQDVSSTYCNTIPGDPNYLTPWVCNPYSRTAVIESVATQRITSSLNYSTLCDSANYTLCQNVANAFGVQVAGQHTDPLTPSLILTETGHAGTQGLNVKVSAYYNVTMLDPIFDRIMGGNSIPVRAEISMQNEGIDKTLGSVPPPAIGNTIGITGSTGTGTGPNGEQIWALNNPVSQGGVLQVHLENHFNLSGPYDVYLSDGTPAGTFEICDNKNTDPATNKIDLPDCSISGAIPPSTYNLYSTLHGDTQPIATCGGCVVVQISSVPKIEVETDGTFNNVAAANSDIKITLLAHQVPDQPFNIYLVYGANPPALIFSSVPATSTNLTYHLPLTIGNVCPAGGATACYIQSRRVANLAQVYAQTDIYVNQPAIVLGGGLMQYAQGEIMHIYLTGHTPGFQYDIKITDGGSNTCFVGRTPIVDTGGKTTTPVDWPVPLVSTSTCPTPVGGWPNGTYTLSSYPATGSVPRNPASMTAATQVAQLANVLVSTPNGPFITIDGGYTWPAGSNINIKANKHPQVNNPYYFKFGSWRVSVPTGSPVDTFSTDASQSAVILYRIPLTATSGVTSTFIISSFINSNNSLVAQRSVTVFPVPVISVLEGSLVSPDTIITIQLLNHAPNSSYHIFYANKLLGDVLTDANGQAQLKYDLRNLPLVPAPDLTNPSNYGIPFDLFSQFTLTNSGVATTQLALRQADLRVTNIQIPASPTLNTQVPITFTLQNTSPVTITRYFDTDFYLDPSPLLPAYNAGQFNFPGDFKVWRTSIPPSSTFTITQPFFIGSYGPHQIYSYGDTSNFIVNETSETNNILSNTLTITCTPTFITDTFTSGPTGWATQLYGNADNNGQSPAIIASSLAITSDGTSRLYSDDNALNPARGYSFVYRTTPITSAAGLDVRVQVTGAPNNATGASAGLELRDSLLDFSGPKLEFGLTRTGTSGQYRVQLVFRDSVSPAPVSTYSSGTVGLGTPIWLRVQRYGGTNTFMFYYVQSSAVPTSWGTPVATATIRLADQVQFGLFANSTVNGTYQRATFDNFSYANPGSCPAAQGQPTNNNTPPGFTQCTDPLQNKGFESNANWVGTTNNGASFSTSAHTGNNSLLAATFDGSFQNPTFYQSFTMTTFVVSSTTSLNLQLYKNVAYLGDGPDANDQFYAVVATSTLLASAITNPALVATGLEGSINYSPSNWQLLNLNFALVNGVNLEDYAGERLYLIFYNNSNSNCVGVTNCHATEYYFDDVKLSPCTTQPIPQVITTRIKGDTTLHPLGGNTQKIAGVSVWAYAENGQLYQTTTIQNGEFDFYNLPATTSGIKYFIYAEYFIISSLDPTQIDTLVANTSVLLTSANNDANPVNARLDLY